MIIKESYLNFIASSIRIIIISKYGYRVSDYLVPRLLLKYFKNE